MLRIALLAFALLFLPPQSTHSQTAKGQAPEELLKDMMLIGMGYCVAKGQPPIKLYCETFTDGEHRYLVFYDRDSEILGIKELLDNGLQVTIWPSGEPA